jgi:hypothetical protein
MANHRYGAICLNGSHDRATCERCIWYQWDERRGACINREEPVCRLYLSTLFPEQSPDEAPYP